MRKYCQSTILIVLIAMSISAQDTSSPVAYLSSISTVMDPLEKETWKYIRTSSRSKNVKRIEGQRMKLVEKIAVAKATISGYQGYQGDNSLRDAVVDYFDLSIHLLNDDYAEILDMQSIVDQSYDLLEAYTIANEEAEAKMDEAFDQMSEQQKAFANTHSITLMEGEESQTTKKLREASAAIDYYNELMLPVARASFEESYVIEALNRGDINGAQQHLNSLNDFLIEIKQQIKDAGAYKGDTKLKYAAERLVRFYEEEASDAIPTMIDFYLITDDMEQQTAAIDAVKPKKRTKKMIEDYNKAINTYNKELNNYNKINEKANKDRESLNNKWQEAIENFFVQHIPR